jgi:hypothetical protein
VSTQHASSTSGRARGGGVGDLGHAPVGAFSRETSSLERHLLSRGIFSREAPSLERRLLSRGVFSREASSLERRLLSRGVFSREASSLERCLLSGPARSRRGGLVGRWVAAWGGCCERGHSGLLRHIPYRVAYHVGAHARRECDRHQVAERAGRRRARAGRRRRRRRGARPVADRLLLPGDAGEAHGTLDGARG